MLQQSSISSSFTRRPQQRKACVALKLKSGPDCITSARGPNQGLTKSCLVSSPCRISRRVAAAAQAQDAHLNQNGASSSPEASSKEYNAYVDLFICTFLWGTYGPAIRFIFQNDALQMDAATLMTIRGVIGAIYMGGAYWWNVRQLGGKKNQAERASSSASSVLLQSAMEKPTKPQSPIATFLNSVPKSLPVAGFEIGFYNTMGACFEATGLITCSATRGGFLIQLAALVVPLLCVLAGETISKQVLFSVAIGFVGILMVTFDGMMSTPAVSESVGMGGGELWMLGACFFYSMAVIRIGKLANHFDAKALTALEKALGVLVAVAWLVALKLPGIVGQSVDAIWNSVLAAGQGFMAVDPWTGCIGFAVIVYTAIGPGAIASVLQTEGMRLVPATQSQLIFSLTPLWSAAIAMFTVGQNGSESMGALSWAGAILILAATLMAGSKEDDNSYQQEQVTGTLEGTVLQPVVVTVQPGMQGGIGINGGPLDALDASSNQLNALLEDLRIDAEEFTGEDPRELVEVNNT